MSRLQPSTHKATVALHPAAIRSLAQEPADPDEASSRHNAAGVKREGAGVKREREDAEGDDDEPAVPRSATAAERVDLTEEVCVSAVQASSRHPD